MNDFLLALSRENKLFPQSPDEDLASRLILQSRRFASAARRAEPDAAALLAYLAAHQLGRGLLAAKGYRPASQEAHRTVTRVLAEWAPAESVFLENLREYWNAQVEEPDMPLPRLTSAQLKTGTARLVETVRKLFVREFPAFKPLFRSSARTISPERSFRD
jgi:hypothetical protein